MLYDVSTLNHVELVILNSVCVPCDVSCVMCDIPTLNYTDPELSLCVCHVTYRECCAMYQPRTLGVCLPCDVSCVLYMCNVPILDGIDPEILMCVFYHMMYHMCLLIDVQTLNNTNPELSCHVSYLKLNCL